MQQRSIRVSEPSRDASTARPSLIGWIAVAVMVPVLLTAGLEWADLAAYHYDWDPGEGDNLYYAARLAAGEPLYGDYDRYPMTGSCYPPFYHALLAPLVGLFGREVVIGRIVSWLAMLAGAVLAGRITREVSDRPWAGVLAGLLYLGTPITRQWACLARVDALLVALSLASIWFLCLGPVTRKRMLAGVTCGVLAVLTKQYALLFLLAGLVVLLRRDRRLGLYATLLAAGAGGILLAILQWWSDGWFWHNVVTANATDYSLAHMLRLQLTMLRECWPVLILGAAALAWREGRGVLLAVLVPGVLIALLSGKDGASINYQLPLMAGVAVLASATAARLASTRWRTVLPVGLLIQAAIWIFLARVYTPGETERLQLKWIEGIVRSFDGEVLIDRHMTLQYRAGQPTLWEPCLLYYLYLYQRWNPEILVEDIRRQRFAAIFVSPNFLSGPLHAAMNRRYRRVESIYVPDWTGGTALALYKPVDADASAATSTAPDGE